MGLLAGYSVRLSDGAFTASQPLVVAEIRAYFEDQCDASTI
jgi:hypothetical protein